MARFLFVVPPLTGHVVPTLSVAASLRGRGHEVAWVGHPGKLTALLPEGARLFALDDRVPDALVAEMTGKAHSVRGLSGLKFLWEDFLLPLARAMVPGVEAAVAEWEPDVLVVDQQALAGGVVARRHGITWATSATTSAAIVEPLAGLPKVKAWLDEQQAGLQREFGLEPTPRPDCSEALVLVFSTRALVGDAPLPDAVRFVGPAFSARAEDTDFDFGFLDGGDASLLVSLGTVNADRGTRFFRAVCEAVAQKPWRVVIAAPEAFVPSPPDNVLVKAWVPQLALLSRVDAVVTHAGHNTVCEALWHGRPLVVAPIKDDQPVVAQQVVDAGAGVRVKFGRARAAGLLVAMEQAVSDPALRAAAERVGRSFREAGGAEAAADALEALC